MDLSAELTKTVPAVPLAPSKRRSPPPSDPQTDTSGTCLVAREIAVKATSLVDETTICCSRSLSGDDADMDSLPSLSYTTSEHSSSTLSRSSSVASSPSQHPSVPVNSLMDSHDHTPTSIQVDHDSPEEEEDPLSYHSDFDYYTKSFSDLSDSDSDQESSSAAKARHHSPPPNVTVTPYSSLYNPVVLEPLPSADTMRRVTVPHSNSHVALPNLPSSRESDGWRGHTNVPESQRSCLDNARGWEAVRPNGGYLGGQPSGTHRGDDNDGDKARRGKPRPSAPNASDHTSSSDDDADGITVYYSLDGMSNGPPSRPRSRHSKAGGGSDDDVPLAQRVPTALSAQKSIRKQLHDERQQRRLERAKSSRKAVEPPLPSQPTEPLSSSAAPARFRKRSMSAAPAPASGSRTAAMDPFPVEDLTRKLMSLQASSRTPPQTAPLAYDNSVTTTVSPRVPACSSGVSRSSSRGKYTDHTAYLQQKTSRIPETSSQLRSQRSFHRPDGRYSETQWSPIGQTSAPRLGRSATAAASSSRTARVGRDAGLEQHPKSGRVNDDGRKPSASVPRSSIDRENDVAQRAVQRPPVPPLPISDSTPPQLMSKVPVVQQRIFIGDMQRFNMVEITPATNAGGVIDTVARQGTLDKSGSWMVFELAQDYGMGRNIHSAYILHSKTIAERPIRDYELLSDVSASWNKDKLLNAFVIKQTPLAPLLSRSVSHSRWSLKRVAYRVHTGYPFQLPYLSWLG